MEEGGWRGDRRERSNGRTKRGKEVQLEVGGVRGRGGRGVKMGEEASRNRDVGI